MNERPTCPVCKVTCDVLDGAALCPICHQNPVPADEDVVQAPEGGE